MTRIPRVLTIASSDSGGGAGIQADLKAFARCGAHGMSAIVALTAQNTVGVTAIQELPPAFVRAQIDAVLDDIGADAAKTGMLFSAPLIQAVADALAPRDLPLVVDPVMVASSGARLLLPDAVDTLVARLFPLATVVTPNLPEAQALTGLATEDRVALAEGLVKMGAPAALVTGGHGAEPVDHLFDGTGIWPSRSPGARSPRPTAPGARTPRRSRPGWRRACPWPTRPGRPPRWPATRWPTACPTWAAAKARCTSCTTSRHPRAVPISSPAAACGHAPSLGSTRAQLAAPELVSEEMFRATCQNNSFEGSLSKHDFRRTLCRWDSLEAAGGGDGQRGRAGGCPPR